jgi:hypothetical protein
MACGCATGQAVIAATEEHHAGISRKVADLADATDRAFGETRLEDRQEIVRATVGVEASWCREGGTDRSVPSSFRRPMPALERKANLFLALTSRTDSDNMDDLSPPPRNMTAGLRSPASGRSPRRSIWGAPWRCTG